MAGMQPFALCGKIAAAYCASLAADGCPSSQIAIVAPSAVPLWKVIVGPRADELQTGPARVRFSLCAALRRHLCSLPRAFGGACAAAAPDLLLLLFRNAREDDQWR